MISTILLADLWILFFEANVKTSLRVGSPVGLGAMLLELAVVAAYVLRRQALRVSRNPFAWAAAIVGAFGMLSARPDYEPVFHLEWLYYSLQLAGAVGAALSLLSLRRSFGLVAANRGVQTRGPYRFIRHPTYSCYLLVLLGYLLENPSLYNLFVLALVTLSELVRIHYEEALLRTDPAYTDYARSVRYRLIPYLY